MAEPEALAAAAAAASSPVAEAATLERGQLPLVYHPGYNVRFWGLEKLHPFDSCKVRCPLRAPTARRRPPCTVFADRMVPSFC